MRAAIRSMTSPDVDVENYSPDDPEDVAVFVQVIAGPADEEGAESFNIDIVTPAWLAAHVKQHGPLVGRHYLIVDRWDWPTIRAFLTAAIEREEASTWSGLGERLARIGHWEFEDYQPRP